MKRGNVMEDQTVKADRERGQRHDESDRWQAPVPPVTNPVDDGVKPPVTDPVDDGVKPPVTDPVDDGVKPPGTDEDC
jgi:hypothetical protein